MAGLLRGLGLAARQGSGQQSGPCPFRPGYPLCLGRHAEAPWARGMGRGFRRCHAPAPAPLLAWAGNARGALARPGQRFPEPLVPLPVSAPRQGAERGSGGLARPLRYLPGAVRSGPRGQSGRRQGGTLMLKVLTFVLYQTGVWFPWRRAAIRAFERAQARRLAAGHWPRHRPPERWRLSAPRRARGTRMR